MHRTVHRLNLSRCRSSGAWNELGFIPRTHSRGQPAACFSTLPFRTRPSCSSRIPGHASTSLLPSSSRFLRISARQNSPTCDPFDEDENTSLLEQDKPDFGNYQILLPQEPFIFGVNHIKRRSVPKKIARPPNYPQDGEEVDPDADLPDAGASRVLIPLGGEEERKIRASCKLAAETLRFAGSLVKPGVTTVAIDDAVHKFIVKRGAYPSPLGYGGFPKACCTSVNNVAVHGIPDKRPLQPEDIVKIDITVYLDGYHGDTCRTFVVSDLDVDQPGHALVAASEAALAAGIEACGPGKPFRGIGKSIYNTVVKGKDLSPSISPDPRWRSYGPYCVSDAFSGHGIGTEFHRPPWIYHSLNEEPGTMAPGDVFTIEPVVIQGSDPSTWIFPDGWTASTENCARAAQAEHTVLITEDGVEVLTRLDDSVEDWRGVF
ncbi:methionine aminopeptidase [Schizophyllum commune]